MKFLYLLALVLVFSSCDTQKQINKTGYTVIRFGSGGGITGNTVSYSLYPNGKVWKSQSLKRDSVMLNKLPKSKVKELYLMVNSAGLDTVLMNQPGNLFYFIDIEKKNETNKLVWGRNGTTPPVEVLKVYDKLTKSIK